MTEFGGESEAQKIHRENVEKLSSMSPEEIMKEREQLLTSLGNEIVFKKSLPSSGYHHLVEAVFKLILQQLHFPEHIIKSEYSACFHYRSQFDNIFKIETKRNR